MDTIYLTTNTEIKYDYTKLCIRFHILLVIWDETLPQIFILSCTPSFQK